MAKVGARASEIDAIEAVDLVIHLIEQTHTGGITWNRRDSLRRVRGSRIVVEPGPYQTTLDGDRFQLRVAGGGGDNADSPHGSDRFVLSVRDPSGEMAPLPAVSALRDLWRTIHLTQKRRDAAASVPPNPPDSPTEPGNTPPRRDPIKGIQSRRRVWRQKP